MAILRKRVAKELAAHNGRKKKARPDPDCASLQVLEDAIEQHDVEAVRRFLGTLNVFKSYRRRGFPIFKRACVKGIQDKKYDIIIEMLRHGANAKHWTRSMPLLTAAIYSGDVNFLREVIDAGGDVDVTYGPTIALYVAAAQGSVEMVRLLLEKGADASKPCSKGRPPLNLAVAERDYELVEMLLKGGSDPAKTEFRGVSIFQLVQGDERMRRLLSELIEDPALKAKLGKPNRTNVVDSENEDGGVVARMHAKTRLAILGEETLRRRLDVSLAQKLKEAKSESHKKLLAAVQANDVEAVDAILGSSRTLREDKRFCRNAFTLSLEGALIRNDYRLPTLFLKRGLKPPKLSHAPNLKPVIHVAVESGDLEFTSALADSGADLDALYISTPIRRAASRGNIKMVKLLLDRGASVHAHAKLGRPSRSPLHLAVEYQDYELARRLVDLGEDVNATYNFVSSLRLAGDDSKMKDILLKNTAMVLAHVRKLETCLSQNDLREAKRLLDLCNVFKVDEELGRRLMISAVTESLKTKDYSFMKLFLSRGLRGSFRYKAKPLLHISIYSQDVAYVRAVIDAGVYIDQRYKAQSPLFAAGVRDSIEIIKLLLDSGANVRRQERSDGKSPLISAAEKKDYALVVRLLDLGADIFRSYHSVTLQKLASSDPKLREILLEKRGADFGPESGSRPRSESLSSIVNDPRIVHEGVRNGNKDYVQGLLDTGMDVNCVYNGITLLHHAAIFGNSKMVKLLIKRGADVATVPVELNVERIASGKRKTGDSRDRSRESSDDELYFSNDSDSDRDEETSLLAGFKEQAALV